MQLSHAVSSTTASCTATDSSILQWNYLLQVQENQSIQLHFHCSLLIARFLRYMSKELHAPPGRNNIIFCQHGKQPDSVQSIPNIFTSLFAVEDILHPESKPLHIRDPMTGIHKLQNKRNPMLIASRSDISTHSGLGINGYGKTAQEKNQVRHPRKIMRTEHVYDGFIWRRLAWKLRMWKMFSS